MKRKKTGVVILNCGYKFFKVTERKDVKNRFKRMKKKAASTAEA